MDRYYATISTQIGSLCHLLRILDVCKVRHRFAEHFAELRSQVINSKQPNLGLTQESLRIVTAWVLVVLSGSFHGRRSVGDGGDASPPLFREGDSIGIVPPIFSSEQLRGISPDSTLLSLKSRYIGLARQQTRDMKFSEVIYRKLARGKQVLRHVLLLVRHNP